MHMFLFICINPLGLELCKDIFSDKFRNNYNRKLNNIHAKRRMVVSAKT